jgi:hypothetical protein
MTVLFLIQSKTEGIFGGFFKLFRSQVKQDLTVITKPASLTVGKGIIEVEKGDITNQTVITSLYQFKRLSFLC